MSRTKDGERLIWFCCDTYHVDQLLRFIVKRSDQHEYAWGDLQVILNTGEQGEFFHIPDLVRPYLYTCVNGRSGWEIAVFAGRYNYQDLFKLAITAFHKVDWPEMGCRHDRLPLICLKELPLRYAIALVTAINGHESRQHVDGEKKWRDISESFKLEDD